MARVGVFTSISRKSFFKDVKHLPTSIALRIKERTDALEMDPLQHDGAVEGQSNMFKVRVGNYRIIFFLHTDIHTIEFVRVRHRREVYRNLPRYSYPPIRKSSYRDRDAGPAERELERLIKAVVQGTRFHSKVLAVGGYVRDELLGKEAADLDVVVAMPYGAQRLCGLLQEVDPEILVEPLALDYPVWHAVFVQDVTLDGQVFHVKGAELDAVDAQEAVWLDGVASTQYGPIEEDVKRRDFTINTLLKDLSTGEIVDPTGLGRQDLASGTLRAIPNADSLRNFREQPRQMLRLIRFMVQYGWTPSDDVVAALKASVQHLADLTEHGLKKELRKLQTKGLLDDALELMRQYNMLAPMRDAWQKAKVAI